MRTKLILAAVIALPIVLGALGYVRNLNLSHRFEQVQIGQDEQSLLGQMGKPSWTESCGKSFGNPGGVSGCAKDYVYRNSFAPLVPEYWSVSLDKNGRVVEKYDYVSP